MTRTRPDRPAAANIRVLTVRVENTAVASENTTVENTTVENTTADAALCVRVLLVRGGGPAAVVAPPRRQIPCRQMYTIS